MGLSQIEISGHSLKTTVEEISAMLPGKLNMYRRRLHNEDVFHTPVENGIPMGDTPIVTIPGLGETDHHMHDIRMFARRTGHPTHSSHIGRNFLFISSDMYTIQQGITKAADKYGRKVGLVAHSMGGVYARRAAQLMPEYVDSITTIASPNPNRFLLGVDRKLRAVEAAQLMIIPGYYDMVEELRGYQNPDIPIANIFAFDDNVVNVKPENKSGEQYIGLKDATHESLLWDIRTLTTLAHFHAPQETTTAGPSHALAV